MRGVRAGFEYRIDETAGDTSWVDMEAHGTVGPAEQYEADLEAWVTWLREDSGATG